MGFVEASGEGFRRYFDFRTRSSRSEFWWFTLFVVIVSIIATVIDTTLFNTSWDDTGMVNGLWTFATIIPSIAIAVRRLHDIDRSGWWVLLWFVFLIGWVVLIVWHCTKGTDGINRFGDDPLGSYDIFD